MTEQTLRWGVIDTRFGMFSAFVDEAGRLVEFWLRPQDARQATVKRDQKAIVHVAEQVREYCAGKRQAFTLKLAARGTPFQHKVWSALLRIPFGTTTSYGALAAKIGHAGAARAVGLANGSNPIGLIVPCHRVIGSDGSLTGYGGGLPLKRALLAHERAIAQRDGDLFAAAGR